MMVKPKPFTDEELKEQRKFLIGSLGYWKRWKKKHMPEQYAKDPEAGFEYEDYRRFLATIAEYKAAMDSAMTQVSSLNQGNIADRKRIEELEKINKVHRDLRSDETGVLHIVKLKEEAARDDQTIADQAATIERLRGIIEGILEDATARVNTTIFDISITGEMMREIRQAIGKEEK